MLKDLNATCATLGDCLTACQRQLVEAGVDAPRLEAELLIGAVTGATRGDFIAWPERVISREQANQISALLARRLQGEPMAYLLGQREFFGLPLAVGPGTLIPRPETELLVELALEQLPAQKPLLCADLGTGSGAIACALAHSRPDWTLIAVERSPEALRIAADNAGRLAPDNFQLIQGDWLAAVADQSLDAVLSNPPYIAEQDPHLQQGDLPFEPLQALAAGPDGLDAIRQLLPDAWRCLKPGGWLALEHGWDQAEAVQALMQTQGLVQVESLRDLAGHWRITQAWRPE